MSYSPIYTSPFNGNVIQPTDVSYLALTLTANVRLYWPSVVNPTQVAAPRILDCTTNTTGVSLALPDATQGTVGTDILIRNYGPNPLVVSDFTGTQTVSLAVGAAQYFYLAANTTIAGVWHSVAFGVGTSYADASALAGPGLVALNGRLAVTTNAVEITSAPTITNADRATTYVWQSGLGTITLPNAASLTPGWYINFRNNGTGTLTLTTVGPSQINGGANVPANPGDSGMVIFEQSTGNFFTIGLANPTNVTFTANTYDVDSIVGNTFSLVSFAPIIQTYVALSGTRTTDLLVSLPQITQIYILVNETSSGLYDLEFKVQGSALPPVVVSAGNSVFAFSDGTNLYALSSQSNNGQFFANNGSASAPSYSFLNDNATGMYLVGTGILGLSSNGVNAMTFNGSNPANLQISTTAQFNAKIIAGGQF